MTLTPRVCVADWVRPIGHIKEMEASLHTPHLGDNNANISTATYRDPRVSHPHVIIVLGILVLLEGLIAVEDVDCGSRV